MEDRNRSFDLLYATVMALVHLAPAAKFEYSKFKASWLGHMLCKLAGRLYEQLLVDRIAGPLMITGTVITLSPN